MTILGGMLGPVVFTAVTIVCATLRPGYSHLRQFISELGANGTSYARIMNLAGFIPAGLLIAGFAVATAFLVPQSRRSILAAGLIGVFGLGIAGAGFLHCDPGCPQHGASLESTIHDRVSVAAFLACIAGIGILASLFRRTEEFRPLWKYTALSCLAGLFFFVMLATSLETRALTGLWQRLMLATLFVWHIVLGGWLLRSALLFHTQSGR